MTKQISKVVLFYTDGTFEEVKAEAPVKYSPPKGPFIAQPAIEPIPSDPYIFPNDPSDGWKFPGEVGKWPFPPPDIGIKILD